MTDKQIPNERRQYEYKSVYPEKSIAIDGVDVRGCEFYFGGCCGVNGYIDCTETPSCYYKQLKRKEQECERLKSTLTEIKELLLKTPTDSPMHCVNSKSVILQKISEVEE